jgi:hypothetical protein
MDHGGRLSCTDDHNACPAPRLARTAEADHLSGVAGLLQERGQACPLAFRQRRGFGNELHDVVVQGSGVAPPIVLDVGSPAAQLSAHPHRRQITVTDKPGDGAGVQAERLCNLGAGQEFRRGLLSHGRSRKRYDGATTSAHASRYGSRRWP